MVSSSHSYQRTLHADLDTPVSAYLKLRAYSPWSFLYESVEGPEHWARYSILGFGAKRTFVAEGGELTVTTAEGAKTTPARDPLDGIRTALENAPLLPPKDGPAFVGGIFGYLSYDAVQRFETIRPDGVTHDEVPDACFVEPEVLAVFDSRTHSLTLYADSETILDDVETHLAAQVPERQRPSSWQEPEPRESRDAYMESVAKAKEHIRAGDIIQVVLSRRFCLPRLADPFDVYRGLRVINPSPYLYYFSSPSLQIAGASPEVMVRVEDNHVTVRPIAGTRPRGTTPAEDAELAEDLLADPKERAEHIMLVDLGRNDVGRVAVPGTVSIPDLMVIENYSHVMHIVSEVRGELDKDIDAFSALRAAFPAGTLSGAPKIRAMQIIDELEASARGIYGGAVGYFGPNGNADFGIAIRTLVAYPEQFVIQAGAGIVADSDPERETDETEHKARAVVRAVQWATEQWRDGA